jgi:hypothetical protein
MSLSICPIPCKRAQRWIRRVHRRLPTVTGGMWAVCVRRNGKTVGVALVGRPTARLLDGKGKEAPQPKLQVLRVAVVEGDEAERHEHKGACSMLYGACARAARAMGATDLWTYIHDDESGVSLKAAGWIEDTSHYSKGGSYDRPSRMRRAPVEGGPKRRWFAPWSAMLKERVDGSS